MKENKLCRRDFFSKAIYGPMALGMIANGCRNEKRYTTKQKRPNIIFLLSDDQRWDSLGCMGNPIVKTPTIDNMAKNGVLFTHAFVTTSICMTSRASVLTGQYARRHQINDFSQNLTTSALSQTYPMLLRSAGYRTGFVGKYGIGSNELKDEFDEWHGIAGPEQPEYEQVDQNGQNKHLTELLTAQSIGFLKNCTSSKQPFCLSISYKAPHAQDGDPRQFIYNKKYDDLYNEDDIPNPKTATSKHFEALPDFLKTSEARARWKKRFATPQMYQKSVKGYYRLISGIDDSIKQIRETLRNLNLDDNTVIIFIGDNGFYLGEHGLAGKWFAHEESIRVPLVVYDPRLEKSKRGKVCDQLTLNIDMAPTILNMAGVDVPQPMQGESLMPLVNGTDKEWRTDFFYEHMFDHPEIPKSEAVRNEKFKYIKYIEQHPVYEELYDLENDPYEEYNLAEKPKYGQTLEILRNRCNELSKSLK